MPAKPKKLVVMDDVAKPGKSAPSATSKPIIVTNRPVLKDPMVVGEDQAEAAPDPALAEDTRVTVRTSGKLRIEPIADAEPEVAVVEPAVEAKPEAVAETVAEEPKPAEPEAKAEVATEEEASTDEETQDAKDEEDKTEPTDPNSDDIEAQKATERATELEELALSRKFYLPINQVEKRRNARTAVLGLLLILILCAAWADIALDAGIVTIPGITAPTNFFK